MSKPPEHPHDPVGWSGLLASAFLLLTLYRLGVPSTPYFDEVHYLPAARALAEFGPVANQEHPLLGKEIIALGMALFGDAPQGWRIFSALSGGIALFAFMRMLWFASLSRFSTLAGGVLLATALPLFVQSRIAMLDIFMVGFAMVALWMCAAALREPETGRWRLAVAGVALGFSMASKWNVVPLAVLPGLVFLAVRLRSAGLSFVSAKRGAPLPGMSLAEAGVWLGLVPLIAYAITFVPALYFAQGAMVPSPAGFVEWHRRMIELQDAVVNPHPYQSTWTDWVLDRRAIWYLYEQADGAQRGVLLVGNPVVMLGGLVALAWCLWAGVARRNPAAIAMVLLYAASLSLWIVAAKPVQFYYHYFLPSCFLAGALALALDALWRAGWRKSALGTLSASCIFFAYFFPILSAAPLAGPQDFLYWAWFEGWR